MSTTHYPDIPPRRITRPDALSVIAGQGIGTQPGPETFDMPGQNTIQNLLLALNEGLTIPPSVLGIEGGMPERVWDPRILGALAGTIAVLEPGPGGEAKVLKGAGKGAKEGSERLIGTAVKLNDGRILTGPQSHRENILEFITGKPGGGAPIKNYRDELIPAYSSKTYGFLTDTGRYVTPQEAGPIAHAAGQTSDLVKAAKGRETGNWIDLFSEDVRKPWPWDPEVVRGLLGESNSFHRATRRIDR